MTDISIPTGALEAGIAKLPHNVTREELRAAFLAMVGNWEGMFSTEMEDAVGVHRRIILPLTTQEKTDG